MRVRKVPFLTDEGVKWIHPAAARRLQAAGRALRPRGKSFRLASATDGTAATLLQRRRDHCLRRIRIEFSGLLLPSVGVWVRDGRWFRGAILAMVRKQLGIEARNFLSNHNQKRKSPVAFSINESGRVGYLTLLATDDAVAVNLFDRLVEVLVDASDVEAGFAISRGKSRFLGEHTVKIVSIQRLEATHHGIYLGVIAPTEAEAMALVPGSIWAECMGESGHRGRGLAWKVKSQRTHLPIQVGPCGAYGCGLLH